MHPWEDFAETWAHYLHIVDTLEMAYAFGMVSPRVPRRGLEATVDRNPYRRDVETLIDAWLPLTFAVNSLNRSMGQPDLYPFVISAPASPSWLHPRLVHGKLPKASQCRRRDVGPQDAGDREADTCNRRCAAWPRAFAASSAAGARASPRTSWATLSREMNAVTASPRRNCRARSQSTSSSGARPSGRRRAQR